ncbi:Aldo/keto reductase [Pluteus cervinus]|uniref:Aldo/keto reductase n=1 Tax=Pluteus cervinus TaxID=181527 RepID=A0ACD3A2N2_9AGAR|nr:Aldo/keto reductase [Pluteus cervinus]
MTIQVEYRQLGKTGLRVSVPVMGAMTFGSAAWGGPWILEEEKAFELLKAAWDNGINTIDTANMYSNGVSESIVGNFVKKVRPNYHVSSSTSMLPFHVYHSPSQSTADATS